MADGLGRREAVKVWDLPTRIFHWTLAVLVVAMWWTGEEREIALHTRIGTVLVGLLLFRLLWGFFGSETARFSHFLKGPAAVLAYVRGERPVLVGHNPLGGWAIALMLALLVCQAGLGLIAHDVDGLESGPLSHLVSYDTADWARVWHNRLINAILGLVALHIGAILVYFLVLDRDLIVPMISGRKDLPPGIEAPALARAQTFLFCAAAAAAAAWWIGAGAPLPAAVG